MPRPIVEVVQSVATIRTTVTDPTQATLIVGPNYDVVDYDPTATDRSSTKIVEGYDPYGIGSSVWPSGNVVIDLDSRGTLDSDSIKVYLEDAYYEVGVTASDAVTSNFGAADTTFVEMGTNAEGADYWAHRLEHTGGTWKDNATRDLVDGDIVQIDYKLANVFVPNSDFDILELDHIRSPDYYVKLEVIAPAIAATKVFKFSDADSINSSVKHLDLFEAFAEGTVFSTVDGQNALTVISGSTCTLTVCKITDNSVDHTITGTLTVPEQTTAVRLAQSSNSRNYVHTHDRLRQFVSNHLTLATQMSSCRIEAPLSPDYTYPNGISVYHTNADPDWAFVAGTGDLTFSSVVSLQDTDLATASSLPDKAITRADLHIESRSLITSGTSSAITVSSLDVESKLGVANSKNPLGLAASVALQNSGTSTIKVLRISEDTAAGYTSALPYINANPDAYAILPLTQSISTINEYVVAAVSQSKPEVGKFRIVLGSARSAPLWSYWAGNRESEYGRVESAFATGNITFDAKASGDEADAVLVDPEGGFLSVGGPAIGDTLIWIEDWSGGDAFTCIVKSIESSSKITVALPKDTAFILNNANTEVHYTGAKDIKNSREDQVTDILKDIAPLTSNADLAKRLVMVYPGEVSVGTEAGLPGYYLTAAVGGMLAAFEPHRPKNQIALSGIADIEYSNLGYFTDAQIDALSDGGYFVLIQEIAGGLPFCVHQVTTAYKNYASTQEYSELSVVNNFDYISSVFKNSLNPYVGVWNVIPQAYSSIMASLDSSILSLQSRSVDRIGAPLVSGEVVSVEPSAVDAGTVNVIMDVQLPKVLNKIRLEVISQ